MGWPLVLVVSARDSASRVGDFLVESVKLLLSHYNVDLPYVRVVMDSNRVFLATTSFPVLDSSDRYGGGGYEFSLGGFIQGSSFRFYDKGIVVSVSRYPFYLASLYYYCGGSLCVLSPWWVIPSVYAVSTGKFEFNPRFLLTFAAYGYQLGFEHVVSGVRRAPLGSKLIFNHTGSDSGKLFIERGEAWWRGTISSVSPQRLASLLVEASSDFLREVEAQGYRDVWVGLSGGLDSRTVLASLVHALSRDGYSLRVIAYTSVGPSTDPREVELASRVADLLGVEHRVEKEKFDASSIVASWIVPFALNERVGANGTGGDKTLAPLGRIRWSKPSTPYEAARRLIAGYNYLASIKEGAMLFGQLEESLVRDLAGEGASALEVTRFYLLEYRLMNWLTSFKSPFVAPFLHPRFFSKAFVLDPLLRDYFVLYARVIRHLHGELLAVPYYDLGCRLSVTRVVARLKIPACFLRRAFSKVMKGQRGSLLPSESMWEKVEEISKAVSGIEAAASTATYKYREFDSLWSSSSLYSRLERLVAGLFAERPLDARKIMVAINMLHVKAMIYSLLALA